MNDSNGFLPTRLCWLSQTGAIGAHCEGQLPFEIYAFLYSHNEKKGILKFQILAMVFSLFPELWQECCQISPPKRYRRHFITTYHFCKVLCRYNVSPELSVHHFLSICFTLTHSTPFLPPPENTTWLYISTRHVRYTAHYLRPRHPRP